MKTIKEEIKVMCFMLSGNEVSDWELDQMSNRDLKDWHNELIIATQEEAELNAQVYDPENWDW